MIVRDLVTSAALAAIASHVLMTPARADDRHVLHHCEDVMARAAKDPNSTQAAPETEIERCRIVVREWALRDSRMTVDENGRRLR